MNKFLKHILVLVAVSQMVIFTPLQARASLISDIMKGIEIAGYWPSELPAPDAMLNLISLAQNCSESDILTCVNAALDDKTIDEGLGDSKEKIQFAVDVYMDISEGDYLSLILHLGKPAGCFAAAMIVGVPVCTWAEALASIAGAIADVGQEVYNFLQENGASAVWESDDYWDIYYYPNIDLGVQIHLHNSPENLGKAFGELSGPLFNTCYELLEKHHSKSASSEACENLQAQFVAEIHKKLDSYITTGKQNTATEYDKMKPAWLASWYKQCDLPSGAVDNIDDVIESCQQKVSEEIEAGKTLAISMTAGFIIPATVMYDSKAAAEAGYHYYKTQVALKDAVKHNQEILLDYNSNFNKASNVLEKVKYELEAFNKDTGPWQSQCTFGDYSKDCKWELKMAWYSCQKKIAAIPTIDGDLKKEDTVKVNAAKTKCAESYTAVTMAFMNFVDRRSFISKIDVLCPQEPRDSGVLFPAALEVCKKDIARSVDVCGGGIPKFTEEYYKNGKISQTPPGVVNCESEIKFLQDKWGQDGPLFADVEAAYATARGQCVSGGMGEPCVNAVMENVTDCKTGISQMSNALGVIPSVPAYKSNVSDAVKKLKTQTQKCIAEVLKTPEQYAKIKKVQDLALKQYEKECPANQGSAVPFHDQCKSDLNSAIESCLTNRMKSQPKKPQSQRQHGSTGSGGFMTQESLAVEKCKPDLQAVIDDYKNRAANLEKLKPGIKRTEVKALDAGTPVLEKAPLKARKNLLAAPPSILGAQPRLKNEEPPEAPAAPVLRKAPVSRTKAPAVNLPPSVRAVTLPAATPAKQLEEKGCVLNTNSRVANTYNCKSDEGKKLCDELKAAMKVGGCVKVN